MTQIPCPHCGEMANCREEAVGGETTCPHCRMNLQFNTDSAGRPAIYRSQRRWVKRRWVGVVGVFLMGLVIGFAGGWGSARQGSSGFSQSAYSFFFASNHMNVDESKETPPPKPKVPKADEDQVPRK